MSFIKKVSILVDNESWILPFVIELLNWFESKSIDAYLVRDQEDILPDSDVCFMLGCTKIVSEKNLSKSNLNLLVHESDLPKGKGFAPVTWQILEGVNNIPVCLVEASKNVDSGDIWLKKYMNLNGTELNREWRTIQGEVTINLVKQFIENKRELSPKKQIGESSFYVRRDKSDSEIDINKTLAEQFDLMRVVDNEKYPAFFFIRGQKYNLKIEKA